MPESPITSKRGKGIYSTGRAELRLFIRMVRAYTVLVATGRSCHSKITRLVTRYEKNNTKARFHMYDEGKLEAMAQWVCWVRPPSLPLAKAGGGTARPM